MLSIENLHKSFGATKAVNNVTFAVKRGETVVLMGPSGCGKSTTIRCINRLTEPEAGKVFINGENIIGLGEQELLSSRKKIGYVFQQFNLIQRLSAIENVMFGLVMGGMLKEEAHGKAVEALTKVGMEQYNDRLPTELSGGQQQRVAIARALAGKPEVMLWDEPTASLDPILVREVLVVMEDLAKYNDSTMIVVTHELSFALHVANRIILMQRGEIVEEGQPHIIFNSPQSEVGEQYRELIEYQINTTRSKLNECKGIA